MTQLTAIETIEPNNIVHIYGERDEVREIASRLMSLHPAAKEVGERGMQAVAQLAIMCGANPLPGAGEIYVWVDNKGNIVVFLGVAYYRRIASQKDTVMWAFNDRHTGQPRPMTPEERERQQPYIHPNDAAAICEGFKLSDYQALLSSGVPWDAAQQMLKRTSYAVVNRDEMFYQRDTKYRKKGDPVDPPHGRTWQWVAEKRAEIGIYRMLAMVDTTLMDTMQQRINQTLGFINRYDGRDGVALTTTNNGWREDVTGKKIDDWFSYG